ncbi:MAG: hypothetical protein HQK67_10045 [Desulfamplus sp.]|nr:hypothetical protein [Desulfamplus sp.]
MNNEELFGRYNAVYNEIFPLSDDNTKFSFNPKALTDTNISLLLTFPAVLSIKLAEQSDNPKLLKNLQSLKQMSKSHHNINYDDKTLNFIITRIKNQFFFMTNPKAITLDLEIVENLLFSMSQYILLLCFLTKHIKSQEKIIYLSIEEVIEIMNKYLYKNPVHRAFLYLNVCLLGLAEGIVQKKIHDFSTNIETSSPIRSLPIASNKFMMNQRISSNNELFAFIEYPENSDSNNGLGFGININYLEEIPFKIWMTEFDNDFNQPSDKTQIQYYGYLFEGDNIKGKNLTKEISMCIFRTSQEIHDVFNIISQEWDNFIKNPEKTLARNYQRLQPWKDSITKSPDFIEELKNSFLLRNRV